MVHGLGQNGSLAATLALILIHGTTVLSLIWLISQALSLVRHRRSLAQVRKLFHAELQNGTAPADLLHRWTTAADSMPDGWARSRVAALIELGGQESRGADNLRDLTARDAARVAELPRTMSGALVLLGLVGMIAALAAGLAPGEAAAVQWVPLLRGALSPAFAGLLSAAVLTLFTATLRQCQLAHLSQLETFSLTILEPRLLPTDAPAALAQCVTLLAESSRQLCSAAQPLAAGLEQVCGQFRTAADEFSQRLEHASHNLLQSVESVRAAATEFQASAGSVGDHYEQLEAMHRHVEAMASQLAGSHEQSQARLDAITVGLHGITQSLTTVVASSNQAQEAVAGVAVAVTGSVQRLEGSVERLVEGLQDPARAAVAAASGGGVETAGVTLRQMMELQRQFINTLDHRLSRPSAPKPRESRTPESALPAGGTRNT